MSQAGIINIPGTVATSYVENTGTAVPSGGVLNVLGGTAITTSGAGSTITINAAATVATSYVSNSGTAVPAANALNIVGGSGITTSGAGSTITITASPAILQATSVLSSAQVKLLSAGPVVLIAAPGAGKTIMFFSAQLKMTYGGTNAFTNPQNLVLRYQGTTGNIISSSIVGTGFIDQTSSQYQQAIFVSPPPIISAANFENQLLCIHNPSGSDITGNAANNNTLTVTTFYSILTQ